MSKPNLFAARETLLHNLDDVHAQSNLQYDKLPEFEPNFGELWLTKDSSFVDFVDDGRATGGNGLLVSEKALTVLQKLKLPPNRAYALKTIQNGKRVSTQYYWLQILSVNYHEWINFSKSAFQLKSRFEMDTAVAGDIVKIATSNEFMAILDSLGENDQELHFSRLVFNQKYQASGFDIFWLDYLQGVLETNAIVSERLKEAFEANGLVGYSLKHIPIVIDP
ncbi:MAG TPA: hypothetical protein VGD40_21125 [Chryseosolibacter sp.]